VHETPSRELTISAPDGLGVGWTVHAVPFQPSASDSPRSMLLVNPPTAVQAPGTGHDTAESWLTAPAGPGVATTAQEAPFHASASVRWTESLGWKEPTAMHEDPPAVHETEENSADRAPTGFGVGWIDQPPPFHTSARVAKIGSPAVWKEPTALQRPDAGQATEASVLKLPPGGFGVVMIDHIDPFQRSVSVTPVPMSVFR
jgi:hypothetical protein